jgi:hypothetical protein
MSRTPQILLDSGAYSAFSQGQPIKVNDYISFIKRYKGLLCRYVSLDVIPGTDGQRTADPNRLEAAAKESYRNHQIMKDAGLSPIPVVHHDDRLYWLERYLADGEPYIGLSPIKRSLLDAIRYLDAAFALISDASASANVKTHGFGVTTALLCKEYPWTSIDSATWLKAAGVGQILIPIYVDDAPDYSQRPRCISITESSTFRPNHINYLPKIEMEEVRRFLQENVGVGIAQARNDFVTRWRINVTYFRGLEASSRTHLFFVSALSETMGRTLLQCGAKRHLLSYYLLKGGRSDALEKHLRSIGA